MDNDITKYRRCFLAVICVILIGLNVYSLIICSKADVDFEHYKEICNTYKLENYSDDELANLQIELETGQKIIWKSLWAFVFKMMYGVILIPTICIIPKYIYSYYKENYSSLFWDFDDKISIALFIFMIIIAVIDIFSPLDEIANYWKLGRTMIDVMNSINIERAISSFK